MSLDELRAKLSTKQAVVAIIGQGYVGLPLAVTMAKAGQMTYGIDIDISKIEQLSKGYSCVLDISNEELAGVLDNGRYIPTTDFSVLTLSDVAVICVPTPLRKSKDPDVSYIVNAVEQIRTHMHRDLLIVLESTTYPGTTEELVVAALETDGYRVGEDFFVCFSPERVDPGNRIYRTDNTPKVVGGVTHSCLELGTALYSHITNTVVPVSSARVAEMVKLLENTFRAVNIGLVNELALMCERMDINIWEVVEAAATKPFGYMPFFPGPGIGGHCIPLDPMYLSWKAKMHDFYNKFIELASDINGNMPRHVVRKVSDVLNLQGKPLHGSRILLLGMAYKRNVDDIRESPSLEVYRLLRSQGALVDFSDPHVQHFKEADQIVSSVPLSAPTIKTYDCAVLTTDHSLFDYHCIATHSDLVVDTRNAFKGIHGRHIFRIGERTPTPEEWTRSLIVSGRG